jgi:hypothetical protein
MYRKHAEYGLVVEPLNALVAVLRPLNQGGGAHPALSVHWQRSKSYEALFHVMKA